MAIEYKAGQTVRVTIKRKVTNQGALKTLERLFMKDPAVWKPMERRSRNFKELPKRRGGQIWTKRPNKLHPSLEAGKSATIKATAQAVKDLNSIEEFIEVAAK